MELPRAESEVISSSAMLAMLPVPRSSSEIVSPSPEFLHLMLLPEQLKKPVTPVPEESTPRVPVQAPAPAAPAPRVHQTPTASMAPPIGTRPLAPTLNWSQQVQDLAAAADRPTTHAAPPVAMPQPILQLQPPSLGGPPPMGYFDKQVAPSNVAPTTLGGLNGLGALGGGMGGYDTRDVTPPKLGGPLRGPGETRDVSPATRHQCPVWARDPPAPLNWGGLPDARDAYAGPSHLASPSGPVHERAKRISVVGDNRAPEPSWANRHPSHVVAGASSNLDYQWPVRTKEVTPTVTPTTHTPARRIQQADMAPRSVFKDHRVDGYAGRPYPDVSNMSQTSTTATTASSYGRGPMGGMRSLESEQGTPFSYGRQTPSHAPLHRQSVTPSVKPDYSYLDMSNQSLHESSGFAWQPPPVAHYPLAGPPRLSQPSQPGTYQPPAMAASPPRQRPLQQPGAAMPIAPPPLPQSRPQQREVPQSAMPQVPQALGSTLGNSSYRAAVHALSTDMLGASQIDSMQMMGSRSGFGRAPSPIRSFVAPASPRATLGLAGGTAARPLQQSQTWSPYPGVGMPSVPQALPQYGAAPQAAQPGRLLRPQAMAPPPVPSNYDRRPCAGQQSLQASYTGLPPQRPHHAASAAAPQLRPQPSYMQPVGAASPPMAPSPLHGYGAAGYGAASYGGRHHAPWPGAGLRF